MRLTLGATIVLMGVLALLLALATGEIYRHEAVENQRDALVEMVQLSATSQMRQLEEHARDLGLALQSEPAFRQAFARRGTALARELQTQFRQYFVTANVIQLEQLLVYDSELHPLAAATASTVEARPAAAGCPDLIMRARARIGTDRVRPLSSMCAHDAPPRFAVLVPVGSLVPTGYLEVITNPTPMLERITSKLGVPVRIRDAQDRNLKSSHDWPPPEDMYSALVAEYALKAIGGETVLKVAVMRDIGPLQDKLRDTRYFVMGLTLAATLIGALVALVILEKTTLRPLNILTQHLRRVTHDKDHLAEPVKAEGLAEIRELADDFNLMARELDRLYGSLEHMAFTDPLTKLANRTRFRNTLEESARQHARVRRPFALLLMDLDRFKAVNDTHGHQIGDLLLQEVSQRLKGVLRGSDTVARLDSETILELDTKLVARLGGDEFAAVLPRVYSMEDATRVAHKLLLSMQEPFAIRDHNVSVGLSIGIALYPLHGNDVDALMQRADAAMYYAKHNQTGLAFPDTMQQTPLL
jgi:GGDEF domain-containing protein